MLPRHVHPAPAFAFSASTAIRNGRAGKIFTQRLCAMCICVASIGGGSVVEVPRRAGPPRRPHAPGMAAPEELVQQASASAADVRVRAACAVIYGAGQPVSEAAVHWGAGPWMSWMMSCLTSSSMAAKWWIRKTNATTASPKETHVTTARSTNRALARVATGLARQTVRTASTVWRQIRGSGADLLSTCAHGNASAAEGVEAAG